MKVTATIAEYNPLHNGHLYQLKQAREATDADYVIIVMAGDYVQRGVPAIINKYSRAKMALMCCADLVLEMPVCYSCSSIEHYADSAIALIDKLGIVNTLSFGSECGDINLLTKLADMINEDDENYHQSILKYMKLGKSYPAAREAALIDQGLSPEYASILKSPNNALGLAYIKALKKRNSTIKPHTVKRIVSGHNDNSLGAYSASSLRQTIITKEALYDIANSTPEEILDIMVSDYKKTFPITENDFSDILLYKIHSAFTTALQSASNAEAAKKNALLKYADISEELSTKIIATYSEASSFTDIIDKVKSKDLTYARISRALMHIILDLTEDSLKIYEGDDYHYYARILGLYTKSSPLFHAIKANSDIPLLAKIADYTKILDSDNARHMLFENVQASNLYEKTACNKYKQLYRSEFTKEIVRI